MMAIWMFVRYRVFQKSAQNGVIKYFNVCIAASNNRIIKNCVAVSDNLWMQGELRPYACKHLEIAKGGTLFEGLL